MIISFEEVGSIPIMVTIINGQSSPEYSEMISLSSKSKP
jgi:hypothetical protein